MMQGAAANPGGARSSRGSRQSISRELILERALAVADEEGVAALTMRRLAEEFGVDAMAIHRQVGGKEGLLDGLVETLWSELSPPAANAGWERSLRSMAYDLRSLAHDHPRVFALVSTRPLMPLPALQLTASALDKLEGAGYPRDVAAEAIRSLFAYAVGYGLTELGLLAVGDAEGEAGAATDIESLVRMTQALPRETPAHLVEVAATVCACDMDRQFTFGLDLMIKGLEAHRKSLRGRAVRKP